MSMGLGIKFAGQGLLKALGPMLGRVGPRVKQVAARSMPILSEADRAAPTWGALGRSAALGAIPEMTFAGLGAAALPEGTPLGERVGAALWNGGIDSVLGVGGDIGIGLGGRKLGLGDQATTVAQMAGMPLVYAAGQYIPRPFDGNARKRAEDAQAEQQAELRKMEDDELVRAVREGTLEELLGPQRQGPEQMIFGWGQ